MNQLDINSIKNQLINSCIINEAIMPLKEIENMGFREFGIRSKLKMPLKLYKYYSNIEIKNQDGTIRISIKDVYEVLEWCVEGGIIEQYLEIYCPFCQRFTGSIYKTIMDVPEQVNCPQCDNEIQDPSKHAIIIYRVK